MQIIQVQLIKNIAPRCDFLYKCRYIGFLLPTGQMVDDVNRTAVVPGAVEGST